MPLDRENVEERLRQTRGIRDMAWLSRGDRARVRRLEGDGKAAGVNQGMREVFARHHACALLSDAGFRHESAPCVQWVADGVVIGEEVTDPARRRDLLASPGVGCLGAGFFLYYDRMRAARGREPGFVYRPLPFGELAAWGGVRAVVSASPGVAADAYLKCRFRWPVGDGGLGTILLGFDPPEGA